MPFEQTGQTGAAPVAAAQAMQTYTLAVDAAQTSTTPIFLLRGMSRLLVLGTQTVGALGAEVHVNVAVADNASPIPLQRSRFRDVSGPLILPLGVPVVFDAIIPAKYVQASITAPAGNAVTVEISFLCSQ